MQTSDPSAKVAVMTEIDHADDVEYSYMVLVAASFIVLVLGCVAFLGD